MTVGSGCDEEVVRRQQEVDSQRMIAMRDLGNCTCDLWTMFRKKDDEVEG